jgi:hypothetical protein
MNRSLCAYAFLVTCALAQHPPHGQPHPQPQPPIDPPTSPPTAAYCSYSIDQPQAAPSSDFNSGPNGMCNAHTSGVLVQGEAKVWGPAGFAAASSDMYTTALRHRHVDSCLPVAFRVEAVLKGRVRAAVQHAGTGSRHGSVRTRMSFTSSALAQTADLPLYAHAQMSQPYQTTPPGAQMVGSQTRSADQDSAIIRGTKTVEFDEWTGRSSVSLSVGSNNTYFGGALVEYSLVDATSSSRCSVHGVSGQITYKDHWKTAFGGLF